jgi:assimilatory nitrate reductase catalytic subunit
MDDHRLSVFTATHCPYCAMQCGMLVGARGPSFSIEGNARFPVNKGGLCIKGWNAAETLAHPDRLLDPLVRDESGALTPASWPAALDRVAGRISELQARYGADAVGVFGSGSLTNEKAYLLGKFARVALGTANIDYNGRFCMSSAAAAATQALGLDRGLPFPLEDIPHANVVLLAGSNVAETMPPLMQYFAALQVNGGRLIVVDPRRSPTAQWGARHLRVRPGSDTALANGLLHVLIRDRLIDAAYIANRTEGFDEAQQLAATYWPERVERLTGVPEADLVGTARMLGAAKRVMILTGRGPEQQAQGVNNALAYLNIALALGQVGKRFGGYGTVTGQGNGQGGREHGQKADQLPGYRRIDDPAARRHMARIWDVPESSIPGGGKSAFELLDSIGRDGGVRALIVMGSNVLVSAPDALRIQKRLRSLDLLVVSDFFLSETAALADVVLPSAQWAEEDGTTTNLEGRVVLRRRSAAPPPNVRTDLEMLVDLAGRLGRQRWFPSALPCDVFDELRRATSGAVADYSGITYQRIEAEDGVFWPCPAVDHPGTPRLFSEGFPTLSGRARFHAVRHQSPAEAPDLDYPLYLTTGRILGQYQSGTQTRRAAKLQELAPEPLAEIHPLTARRFGLRDEAPVMLSSRRGSGSFKVKVTASIREDTVFVPFHWGGEQSINRLTNGALDPVSRMPEFKVCAVRAEAPTPLERGIQAAPHCAGGAEDPPLRPGSE